MRSVRIMASGAPFELLYPMFKNPGPPLLRVAFVTNVRVKFIDLSQTRSCSTTVGCMTVGASQRPLDDPMVVGKIKVGLDVSVAGKTEVRVLYLQEMVGNLRSMNLMTVIT